MTITKEGRIKRLRIGEEDIVLNLLREKLDAGLIRFHESKFLLRILRARKDAADAREARLQARVLREARRGMIR